MSTTNLTVVYRAEDDPSREQYRAPKWRVHCPRPGCRYSASAERQGMAVQAVVTHLLIVHIAPDTKGAA